MEIDMQKLDIAITYLKRIADGNNPVNNMPAEEDAVLNNPNVIRCMYFVRDILEEVKANNGVIGAPVKRESKSRRATDVFPVELLGKYQYREDKSINKILSQLYEPLEDKSIRKISGKLVNEWMMAAGFVVEIYNEELKTNIKVPTEKGKSIGLRSERVEYPGNTYYTISYNRNAQEFLIRNFEKFLNGEVVE